MANECSICENEFDDNDDLVITECNHTFHRVCAQDRLDAKNKTDCHYCHQESALSDALARLSITNEKECSICEHSWTSKDDLVTTECNHTFHYSCAQNRLVTKNRADCHYCHKELTLGDALALINSRKKGVCSICEEEWDWKADVVTTACDHTFHLDCARERLDRKKRIDCHYCHQPSTLGDALSRSNSASIITTKNENTWKCDNCSRSNKMSITRCAFCAQPRFAANSIKLQENDQPVMLTNKIKTNQSKSLYPKLQDPMDFDSPPTVLINSYAAPRKSLVSKSMSRSVIPKSYAQNMLLSEEEDYVDDEVTVYISDLPLNIEDDSKLSNIIQNRLEKNFQIKPISIEYYARIGIGSMHVSNDRIRKHLVDDIKKMALDISGDTYFISFSDAVKFVSYIVIDTSNEKNDIEFPKVQDVRCRWAELYNTEKPSLCDQIDAQFPNIFSVVSTSFNDLLASMSKPDFLINKLIAHVYVGADCSFLEDIPKSITDQQLRAAIYTSIGLKNISSSSIHIELNRKTNNACIITSDQARIWSTKNLLYLDGKPISKKESLPCRLNIYPILDVHKTDEILNEPIFNGKASIVKHVRDSVILEISDKKVFDNCISVGVLCPKGKQRLKMENYILPVNPEDHELDRETWYQVEMLRIKPDIMQFITDLDHPIFRYKWNAQVWVHEFQNTKSQSHTVNLDNTNHSNASPDQIRHLLQVTVMLNTIGVIQKKSYLVNNRKVSLNLDSKLKTLIYNHESILERSESIKRIKIPYKQTKVEVINDDCIRVYAKYSKTYKKPLLLNMASSTTPGGGYRKGDGAQEENLFRRSDYFRSLDSELDFIQERVPERSYCSNDGQTRPLDNNTPFYPIDEYGAIYTSGLTFFRESEDKGYEYMEKPLENVHAIAVAAYRNPKLDGNMLSSKYAVGMRKKIENILSIAFHHDHDLLILSALGCGAFRNPPEHVAKLFHSVIEQYAGFFERIIFAVIDDHNSGQEHNPKGNFRSFKDELDNLTLTPVTSLSSPNTCIGPYRIVSNDSNIRNISIWDLPPCNYGAKCNKIYESEHTEEFSHPPLCAEQSSTGECSKRNDSIHMSFFIHRFPCKYGAQCNSIDDEKHNQAFEHPPYCKNGEKCEDNSEEHEKSYRHLPTCKHNKKCIEYQTHVRDHCEKFRHYIPRCTYDSYCVDFHDKAHIDTYQHPFPTPCPFTPYHCPLHEKFSLAKHRASIPIEIQQHCLNFGHVCGFGRICTDTNPLHWEKYIHIPRCICSDGTDCKKLSEEDHLSSFTHPNIRDIRFLCKYADRCKDRRDPTHLSKYRHTITLEDSGIVSYYNLNQNIDFVQNQKNNIARVQHYITKEKWEPLRSGSIPLEIIDWIRTVRPVHRCRPEIFESILVHGHVMSRDYMEQLADSTFVVTSILQHSRLRKIPYLKEKECAKNVKEYIQALVAQEFEKVTPNYRTDIDPVKLSAASSDSTPKVTSREQSIKKAEARLSHTLDDKEIKTIEKTAIEIAQASIRINANPVGIGYLSDRELGTNQNVFTVLGPHLGHYYGDVFLVFKREILHHPDTNFSIQAATSYASGNCSKWRPWLNSEKLTKPELIKLFHNSKLHPSVPGYEYATALELIALTSLYFKKKSMNIDLSTILEGWFARDSHQNIEAHLPQLIPLDYIDHIYMSQNIFDSLNKNAREFIDSFFKDRITKTKHQLELDKKGGGFGPTADTKSRVEYQDFVLKDIIKKFGHTDMHSISRLIQGTIITIPGTNLRDPYAIPLTISQVYEQYITDHKTLPQYATVYIYWQIMNGDMMLTLSNEQINTGEKQPNLNCLTCYIAGKPSTKDMHYHEQASYLFSGGPFQHEIVIKEQRDAAHSTSFFMGCNTDDFMTFCLEIERSTGKVSLSHSGPNSIYNHEKISATFLKSNLDLNQLNFIHVSAGAHTVPIRNLVVTFQKQKDLHPTFDKKFERFPSSPSIVKRSLSEENANHPSISSDEYGKYDKQTSHFFTDVVDKAVAVKNKIKDLFIADSGSSLIPCHDGIYCLAQYSESRSSHNSKYSHPCRFSELCRKYEPHLTHENHNAPQCSLDGNCNEMCNPVHRARFRHKNWPDFLIPCRDQGRCRNRSDEHRIKYFHGEPVLELINTNKQQNFSASLSSESSRRKNNSLHSDRSKTCKWGHKCHDRSADHRAAFSHPPSS